MLQSVVHSESKLCISHLFLFSFSVAFSVDFRRTSPHTYPPSSCQSWEIADRISRYLSKLFLSLQQRRLQSPCLKVDSVFYMSLLGFAVFFSCCLSPICIFLLSIFLPFSMSLLISDGISNISSKGLDIPLS